jgi:hypothetical protein
MLREIVTETRRDKLSRQTKQWNGKGEKQICGIEMETCRAPEFNLGKSEVKLFSKELKKYMKLFIAAFERVEQIQKSLTYLQGLLGDTTRKNVEQMALGLREKVRSLQYFVGQSQWD